MNYRQKKADAYLDAIQGGVAHQGLNALSRMTGLDRYVDNLGGTVNSAGSLLGLFQGEAPTLEELDEMENNNYGWVPGNATRRTMLRRRMVNKLLGGKPSTIYSEKWGPGTAGAVSMLGGGALGALTAGGLAAALGKGAVAAPIAVLGGMGGMSLGAIASLIANNIGAARAAMTPNRTDEEQQEYEQAKSQWKNWLIPGYARYNWYKSLGVSNRKLKEYQDKKKKDKEDMKKESSYEKIAFGITDKMIKRAEVGIGQTNYFRSRKPQGVSPKPATSSPASTQQANPVEQAQMPLAQEETRAMQYFQNWYSALPEKSQAAARDPRFPYKGPHAAWFSKFMDGERAKYPQNNKPAQPTTPQLTPVQEGTNFSNRVYTPNAVARNSNGENYNTFEKGWMQNSLAPKPQPQQPAFNPHTTPGWGLWTPKQIRDYAPPESGYAKMTPEEFATSTTQQERTNMIKDKTQRDRQAKINGSAENWDNVRANVESTIRTPYQVARWKQLGKTDEEIDAYVKRETDKAMQRRYGARPEEAPVMTPGITNSSEDLSNGEGNTPQAGQAQESEDAVTTTSNTGSDGIAYTFSNPNARQTRFGTATDDFYDPLKVPTEDTVPRVDRIPSIEGVTRPVSFGKAVDPHADDFKLEPINKVSSANIIPLLFNENSSSIVKRLLNGNDLTGR